MINNFLELGYETEIHLDGEIIHPIIERFPALLNDLIAKYVQIFPTFPTKHSELVTRLAQ